MLRGGVQHTLQVQPRGSRSALLRSTLLGLRSPARDDLWRVRYCTTDVLLRHTCARHCPSVQGMRADGTGIHAPHVMMHVHVVMYVVIYVVMHVVMHVMPATVSHLQCTRRRECR